MKRVSVVTSGALALAACGQAVAVTPDSKNPAHCLAAFNYANYWFKVGHSPDDARAMMARGIFELNKIKATGGSVAVAKDEATELTKAQSISSLAENATLATGRSYFPVGFDVTRVNTDVGRMYAYHAGPAGKHFIDWVLLNSAGGVKLAGTLTRKEARDEDYLRAFLNDVRWRSPATRD